MKEFKGILSDLEITQFPPIKESSKLMHPDMAIKIDIVTPWKDDFIPCPDVPGYWIWKRGSEHALCFDIRTNVDFKLPKGWKYKVPTGIFMSLPISSAIFLRERSGLANRDVCLGAGTLDCDYRGEYFCLTRYLPCIDLAEPNKPLPDQLTFNKGDRICQAYFVGLDPERLRFRFVDKPENLSPSVRGAKGFGSSGLA